MITLKKIIERFENNAEFERRNGNLQGCLDFRQLAEWLKDYKRLLEQEPSRDIKEIAEIMKCDADAETKCKMVSNILTAKPHYFEEQEPCDDVVSRQNIIEQYKSCADMFSDEELEGANLVMEWIYKAPSVRPFEQTGHWIRITNGAMKEKYICSKCGRQIEDDGIEGLLPIKYPYCHCGAKMVEPQERSEDKE